MAGLGFVRNNPWVQKDRLLKDSPPVALQNGLYSSSEFSDIPYHQSEPTKTKTVVRIREAQDQQNHSGRNKISPIKSLSEHRNVFEPGASSKNGNFFNERYDDRSSGDFDYGHDQSLNGGGIDNNVMLDAPDIEYGPGIVSRLRQKFLTLAEQATREAEVARALHQAQKAEHTRRRTASVDNLLENRTVGSKDSSRRNSRSGSTRDEPNVGQLLVPSASYAQPAMNGHSKNGLPNVEHSRSVASLNTLIKFFDIDNGSVPTPNSASFSSKIAPAHYKSPSQKFEPSSFVNDPQKLSPLETEFKPIEFVPLAPEEPKSLSGLPHYKSPSAKPSEPLSSLREKFEVQNRDPLPRPFTSPAKKFLEDHSEKSESPKPPSPPMINTSGYYDSSVNGTEPEFLAMRDRLRKVKLTETAASDLKSPPDPSDRSGFDYVSPFSDKPIEVKPPAMDFSRTNGIDHSPPPEEPMPPKSDPPEMLPKKNYGTEQTSPSEKFATEVERKNKGNSAILQVRAEMEREAELITTDKPSRHRPDSAASSVLSSDEETSYEVSEAEAKSASDTANSVPKTTDSASDVATESEKMPGAGLVEMQKLLNKFNDLKTTHEAESSSDESKGAKQPWYEEATHPEKNKSEVESKIETKMLEKEQATFIRSYEETPKRMSLSTQHRLKKQEGPNLDISSSSDSEKKPESTVELLRNMAHTIGQYFPDEKRVTTEVKSVSHERKIVNGVEVDSEEERRVSSSQIVHDTVVDHGGIHYPTNNESGPIQIAGDGNVIHNTFLSLVSEEDLAALLEDENEEFSFTMEGEHGVVKGKGCFLNNRRLQSKGSISFSDTAPSFYAYAQEEDINYWEEGEELNEQQYNTLCQLMRDDYLLKRLEMLEQEDAIERDTGLDKRELKTDVGKLASGGLVNYVPQNLTAQCYELGDLGADNRWAHGDSAKDSGIPMNSKDRQAGSPSSVNPSDSDSTVDLNVRPNSTGDAFSMAETKSADLLF